MMALAQSRWVTLALVACVVVLFFVANRGAYKGYFSDDDLDNLGWPPSVGINVFINGLFTPKFLPGNFRPVGFLYYRYLYQLFKLRYVPYVAVLQSLHLLNVGLLFVLLWELGFSRMAAAAGTLFYLFHAAVLEAYWMPMYVFDVLCATLTLATLMLYVRGHWILALPTFWLAYKSKELAIMLPVTLLAWEWLLGNRKWKRLIPYFLISLSFGLQALWNNRGIPADSSYALHFTPDLLWTSIDFYSSAIFFVPFAGLALLVLPAIVHDRRLVWGLIVMILALVPLLTLSGRHHTVYWYVPLIGLAIMAASIASRAPAWAIALFFVIWFPLSYAVLRDKRREILALADENRWYTAGLLAYARNVPPLKSVVYQGTPEHMHHWGVEGAVHQAFGLKADAVWFGDVQQAQQALTEVPMAIVGYYPATHTVRGLLRTSNELSSYIRFADEVPNFQFGAGWTSYAGVQNRIVGEAVVSLRRPAQATQFELVARGPAKGANVTVSEEGNSLGTQVVAGAEPHALRWKLSAAATGDKKITIQTNLEIAVEALGYIE